MKKILLYCMIIGCLLLAGCNSNPSEISNTENETSAFVFPEASSENETFYLTCQNVNSDIYMNDTLICNQMFCMISLEPIDMNEVEIKVPIENEYAVGMVIIDREDIKMTDYTASESGKYVGSALLFKYYLYQSYRGTDWKKMRELYDKTKEAEKLYSKGTISYNEYLEIKEEYIAYQNLYLEDYNALTEEDLPTYYLYGFRISFGAKAKSFDEYGFAEEIAYVDPTETVSESFQTIDIKIGDTTYTQEIGEIRLHAEEYPEDLNNDGDPAYMSVNSFSLGPSKNPFGDGIMCMSTMEFAAEEDLTLTKLYLYETNATPLTAKVVISDDKGNKLVDIQWDLKSTIPIEKGQQVSVRPIIQDMNATQLEYGARCCAVIEYTVGSETYSFMEEQRMDSLPDVNNGLWIRYAAVFDGLEESLRDYFTYYYPVFEDWREWLEEV